MPDTEKLDARQLATLLSHSARPQRDGARELVKQLVSDARDWIDQLGVDADDDDLLLVVEDWLRGQARRVVNPPTKITDRTIDKEATMPEYQRPTAEKIRSVIEDELAHRVDDLGFHLENFADAVRVHLALNHKQATDDALHEALLSTVSELLRELVYLDGDGAQDSHDERRPRRPQRQDMAGKFTTRFARRFAC